MRLGRQLALIAALVTVFATACSSGGRPAEPSPTHTPPDAVTPAPTLSSTLSPTPTPTATPTPTPGSTGNPVAGPTLLPQGGKTYTHPDLGFSFSYPENWFLDLLTSQQVAVGRSPMAVSIAVDIFGEVPSLDAYTQSAMERDTAELSEVQTVSSLRRTLGGRETVKTKMSYALAGAPQRIKSQLLTLQSGKLGFSFFGSIPEGEPESSFDALTRIVESLQVPSLQFSLTRPRGYVNRCVNDIRRRPSQPLIQWRFHPHTVHRDRRLRSTQGPSDA